MNGKIVAAFLALTWLCAEADDKKSYIPEFHGTVRAKYEYEPSIEKGRFQVRNARIGIEGKVIPIVRYKAEIDLSDEGKIKMLDAYVRLQPNKAWKFTFGQMRVPFTIDAHRSPHLQYFANRSFIAKQVGNVRDVGASAGWTFCQQSPVTLEGGLFNGSGLTGQKNFWTSGINFAFKTQTLISQKFNITLSCQKATAGEVNVFMYDAGGFFQNERWHVEAEYLRKHYAHGAFSPVNAFDVFAAYRLPLKKKPIGISFLGRYDYMSDHSSGKPDSDGNLVVDDPKRHRLTGGITVSLGRGPLQADIRVNYEQYFYDADVTPGISDRSKAVVEFVAHF